MNVPTEEIYDALHTELQKMATAGTVKTASRRLKHIEECDPVDMPVVYQVQQEEGASKRGNLPTVWTLRAEWWLYVCEPDERKAPSSALNPIKDAIVAVLSPDQQLNLVTLGGRVYNACVDGTIEIVEGVLGDRALCIIPIKITKAD